MVDGQAVWPRTEPEDFVFRGPYFLDFLGFKDTYSRSNLAADILRGYESLLLELGVWRPLVARQYRIIIDDVDYFLDLRLYHRRVKR